MVRFLNYSQDIAASIDKLEVIKQLEQMKFTGHPNDHSSPSLVPTNSSLAPTSTSQDSCQGKFERRYDSLVVNIVTDGLPFHNSA